VGERRTEGGKSGVNGYARRMAFVLADCSMGFISARVSSMVALAPVRRSIWHIGLATASEKRKTKVAHYPLTSSVRFSVESWGNKKEGVSEKNCLVRGRKEAPSCSP
jgi:hypothetical protein